MKRLFTFLFVCWAFLGFGQGLIVDPFKFAASGGGGGTPPVFDAASSTSATSVSSLSWSHTCSGNDRLLFVVVGAGSSVVGNRVVTSVTYNGVALTQAWALNGPGWVRNEGWYLVAPATGANTVVVTYAGNNLQAAAGGVSFTGVNQTTPVDTAATASGNTGNPTVVVSSATTDIVISGVSSDAQTTLAVGGTGTQRWRVLNVDTDTAYGSSTDAGASSVTMIWTQSGNENWAMGGVSINPL
jgi:hypothetical protein